MRFSSSGGGLTWPSGRTVGLGITCPPIGTLHSRLSQKVAFWDEVDTEGRDLRVLLELIEHFALAGVPGRDLLTLMFNALVLEATLAPASARSGVTVGYLAWRLATTVFQWRLRLEFARSGICGTASV